MRLVRRLGLTPTREHALVRLLQLAMVAIFLAGLWLRQLGVVVNAGIGLLVTLLPASLERNYQFTMAVGLVLWITVAMFLHAVGMLPIPGLRLRSLYGTVWWWDHVTHALSSSLVAGVAYSVVRALEEHTDAIHLPPRFMFAYLLVFVLALGVCWELIEYYLALGARLLGSDLVLVQYGLEDTLFDLFYNAVGGLLVALFGSASLTDVVEQLVALLERRTTGR